MDISAIARPLQIGRHRITLADAALALDLAVITAVAAYHVPIWPARLQFPGDDEAASGIPIADIALATRGVQLYRDSSSDFHAAFMTRTNCWARS
jgi:hypothetical protein